jgi:hypothetical protein
VSQQDVAIRNTTGTGNFTVSGRQAFGGFAQMTDVHTQGFSTYDH